MEAIEDLIHRGQQRLNEEDLEAAEKCFRDVLQRTDRHAVACSQLAAVLILKGMHKSAAEMSARALVLEPNNESFHHQMGVIQQKLGQHSLAVGHFWRVIENSPRSSESLYQLAKCYLALRQSEDAIALLRRTIDVELDRVEAQLDLARTLTQVNRPDEALEEFQKLVSRWPECGEAQFELSQLYARRGDHEASDASLANALRHLPQNHSLLNEVGIACSRQGRIQEAIRCFERAVQLAPSHASAHNNLGNALKLAGRLVDAANSYRAAIDLQPASADFEMNLGRALEDLGRKTEALCQYRNASELGPTRADAHAAQATVLASLGKSDESVQSVLKALELAGADTTLHVNLANLLQEIGRHKESEQAYRRAIEINPDAAAAYSNLAYLLSDQGRNAEARQHYDAALRIAPSPRLRVVAAAKIPPIFTSNEEIEHCRSELSAQLQSLYADGVRVDTRREMMPTLFYLTYHGRNDRGLLEQLAKLSAADASIDRKPLIRRPSRIRIGFLSMNLNQHTIGGLWASLIEGLSRDRFEVRVLTPSGSDDSVTRRIRSRADAYILLPKDVGTTLRILGEQELDVLFFPDIGMDPFTYTLAYSRSAPIQCVTWGHPSTTGLDSIDYFLSSEHLETPLSDEFYTEKLVRFRHVMSCYNRPALPTNFRRRSQMGLPENAHLYGCPQSLFKFHPDFDDVIGSILERDPQGILVLIEGRYSYWNEQLMQRFQRKLGKLCDRIRMIPRLTRPEYLNLLAVTDVLLDTIHFGGGNTSYEGFAMGIPILTLPTELLRARLTYAMYRQMGMNDCIAHDHKSYVSLAVELGTNSDLRQATRQRILAAGESIFDDRSIIQEFEDFIEAAVAAEMETPGARIDWRPQQSNQSS